MVNLTQFPGDASPYFSNGFYYANEQNISTCGRGTEGVNVTSSYLTVWVPFSYDGKNYTQPLILPYIQSFHYSFPGRVGNWQVDNLSAPGGPGGGWAFNYVGSCTG